MAYGHSNFKDSDCFATLATDLPLANNEPQTTSLTPEKPVTTAVFPWRGPSFLPSAVPLLHKKTTISEP